MKYFFDTEFQESVDRRGRGILWLISLGIVCEDGRSAYWECRGFDWPNAQEWQVENVLPHLTGKTKLRKVIRDELVAFVGDDAEPEFWAYVDCYDWVAMMQLFGGMMNKPANWPHSSHDLKELMSQAGLTRDDLPAQEGSLHRADDDAAWVRTAHDFVAELLTESERRSPVRALLSEWRQELDSRHAYSGDPDPGGTRTLERLLPLLEEAVKMN